MRGRRRRSSRSRPRGRSRRLHRRSRHSRSRSRVRRRSSSRRRSISRGWSAPTWVEPRFKQFGVALKGRGGGREQQQPRNPGSEPRFRTQVQPREEPRFESRFNPGSNPGLTQGFLVFTGFTNSGWGQAPASVACGTSIAQCVLPRPSDTP